MRNYLLLTITAFFLMSMSAVAQTEEESKNLWTLEDCINYAHDYNLSVQGAQLDVRINEVTLRQSELSRIPTANFNLFNSWRWGRSIDPTTNVFTTNRINSNGLSFNSGVTVYNGNQQTNTVRRNRYLLQSSQYDFDKMKNDISLMVVNGYLNVILAKELLENAKRQFSATSAQLDQTTKMVEAGSLPVRNQLDLQAQKASNEVDVINNENQVQFQLLQLKQWLQIPASEPFDVVTPNFEKDNYVLVGEDAQEIYQVAEKTQPDIKSADLQIQSSDMDMRIAKGSTIPELTLGFNAQTNFSDATTQFFQGNEEVVVPPTEIGQLGIGGPAVFSFQDTVNAPIFKDLNTIGQQWQNNFAYSLGFNLAIPVFNGNRARANIQRAKLVKQQSQLRATEVRNTLRQTIETAHNDAVAAQKVLEAAREQVKALEESFRATEKSYNLGAVNFVDYQVSSYNYFTAQSDLLRAKYDYIFKIKILDFYLGNPLTLE